MQTATMSSPDYTRAGEFSALVRHFALANGDPTQAAATARTGRASPHVIEVLERAVTPGVLDAGLTGYNTLASAFIDALRSRSAFARMAGDGATVRLPFGTRAGSILSGAVAGEVAPGQAIPVRSLSLSAAVLTRSKASAILILTRELLSAAPAAESLISRSLSTSVAAAVDGAVLTSLLAGVTGTPSSDAPLSDLRALIAAISPGASSRIYLIADPSVALVMATASTGLAGSPALPGVAVFSGVGVLGGTVLGGIPLLVSDGAPAGTIIAVDASRLAANLPAVEISISGQASIEMDDQPSSSISAGSPPAPVHTSAVSMFQTGAVAIRALQYFGCEPLAPGAIASLEGVNWA